MKPPWRTAPFWLAAAGMLCGLTAIALVIIPRAHADTGTDYGNTYASAICATLDDYPSVAGIIGISRAIVEHDQLTYYQAGEAIATAINQHCPRFIPIAQQMIAAAHNGTGTLA